VTRCLNRSRYARRAYRDDGSKPRGAVEARLDAPFTDAAERAGEAPLGHRERLNQSRYAAGPAEYFRYIDARSTGRFEGLEFRPAKTQR
jgi:hypothetical protein